MPAAHQAGSPGFGGGPRKQGPEVAALRPSCIQLEATSDVSEGQSGDGLGGGAGGGCCPWGHAHFTEVEVEPQKEELVSGSVGTWLGEPGSQIQRPFHLSSAAAVAS